MSGWSADKPVERETLLPGERDGFTRSLPGSLPSRAAENLIWLGRYVERSEDTVRILRAYHVRLAETSDPGHAAACRHPRLSRAARHRRRCGDPARPDLAPSTAPSTAPARSATASRPMAGWRCATCRRPSTNSRRTVAPGDDATRAMTVILRKLAGFSGLLHENMYRFTGWRFLEIGRRLERGIQIARTLGLADARAMRRTARST